MVSDITHTIPIVLNYSRDDDITNFNVSYKEFINMVCNIQNWCSVNLEVENFLPVKRWDKYAIRLIVDNIPVGYVSKQNSPVVHLLHLLSCEGLINMNFEVFPFFEEGGILKNINLKICITCNSHEIKNLVEKVKLHNVDN